MPRVKSKGTVDAPIGAAYEMWKQLETLPKLVGGLDRIEKIDREHVRWHLDLDDERASFLTRIT